VGRGDGADEAPWAPGPGNGGTDSGRPATVDGMTENILTDGRRTDGGPSPATPARPGEEIKLVELRKLRLERVVLVGVAVDGSVERAERSVEELHRLAETAGAEVLDAMIQRRARPDAGTFIGKGKAKELAGAVKALGADTVIMDDELSPGQLRHLEELVDAKVIDRTVLILDIFAQHATSREGKAQVELAQLNYMLPRLRGWGESLTRVGSGMGSGGPIGTRGPGETKMEVDRRRIRRRITKLRRDLADMARTRDVKRRGRERAGIPGVALVGYTNAGKSTLLNRLSGAGVLVEDKLFSTLDPTTRRLDLPGGRAATFTDTVGFIAKLPHDLVEAFKSTLEEVALADLIVHLVDAAQPDPGGQMAAVRSVLGEVGAADVPELLVLNKADLLDEVTRARLARLFPGVPMLSAATGEGVDDLLAAIATRLPHPEVDLTALVPYDRGDLVDRAHREGEILEVDHVAEGTHLRLRAPAALAHALAPFRQPAPDDEDARVGAAAPEDGTARADGIARERGIAQADPVEAPAQPNR
jgi:GTPase